MFGVAFFFTCPTKFKENPVRNNDPTLLWIRHIQWSYFTFVNLLWKLMAFFFLFRSFYGVLLGITNNFYWRSLSHSISVRSRSILINCKGFALHAGTLFFFFWLCVIWFFSASEILPIYQNRKMRLTDVDTWEKNRVKNDQDFINCVGGVRLQWKSREKNVAALEWNVSQVNWFTASLSAHWFLLSQY